MVTIDEVELDTQEYLEDLVRMNKLVKTNKKLGYLMGYLSELAAEDGNQSAEPMDIVKKFVLDMNELSGVNQ